MQKDQNQNNEELILEPKKQSNPGIAYIQPEIIIAETNTSYTAFKPTLIKNDSEYYIDGEFIYAKCSKNEYKNKKIDKRKIKDGQAFELHIGREQLWNFYSIIAELYKSFKNEDIPKISTRYIKVNDNEVDIIKKFISNIKNTKDLEQVLNCILDNNNLQYVTSITKIKNLEKIANELKKNIEDNTLQEQFWQNLFKENDWILGQLFSEPYIFFLEHPNIGGVKINNKGSNIPDFLYKNNFDNVCIIEIKMPKTKLLSNDQYRKGVYSLDKELSGAINQLLKYKQTLYHEWKGINNDPDVDLKFKAININCILIIGDTKELSEDKNKIDCFENFRNELRSIRIVTFDEILCKIQNMLNILREDINKQD